MSQFDSSDLNRGYAEATRRAWTDPAFRAKLLADPRAALLAEGVQVPADIVIKVVENTKDTINIVLPAKPSDALSDEALAAVSAGLLRIGACTKCSTTGGSSGGSSGGGGGK